LLVTMEPPATLEEEFNDWYDTEHLPERERIPGFESARRFVCVSGWPRYVAFYDLEEPGVLDRPPYRAISGSSFSPWSKRILNRVRGLYRALGPQIWPGTATIGPSTALVLLRFANVDPGHASAIVEGMRKSFESRRETAQVRLFRAEEQGRTDIIGLAETRGVVPEVKVDPGVFGPAARHLDLVNTYAPYFTRGRLAGVFPQARGE
jgi:hypothetical protein